MRSLMRFDMSETKWPAGKFHVDGDGIHRLVRDDSGRILAIRHRMSKDENEALMNLFAAAPQLYSVVDGFRWKLHTYVSVYPGDKELRRLLDECDAALAKARGEQP